MTILKKATLLLVCNDPEDTAFFERTLGSYCDITSVASVAEAEGVLASSQDITLTLLNVPNFADFFREVKDNYGEYIPAVVCVDGNSEEDSAEALRLGAFEILRTPFHEEVVKKRVLNMMSHLMGYRCQYEGSERNISLIFGHLDNLTQLNNRVHGERIIARRLADADFRGGLFLLMDVDRMKKVNDTFGRQRGDGLLLNFTHDLREFFDDAVVCRLGGDEFAVFWEVDPDSEEVKTRLAKFSKLTRKTVSEGDTSVNVGISVGMVRTPLYGKTFEELCQKADKALYRSKTMGLSFITEYSDRMLFAARENENYDITPLDYQNIMDSVRTAAICAITADEHRVLYFNQRAAEIAPRMRVGSICHEVWEHDCSTCPILNIGDAEFTKTVRFDAQFGEEVEITATKLLWHDRTPAFLMQFTPLIRASSIKKNKKSRENEKPVILNAAVRKSEAPADTDVIVGQYTENIFCLDGAFDISEREQTIIDNLLLQNYGVGLLMGYYDDGFTIHMVSDLAVRVLRYTEFADFYEATGGCLLNTVKTEEERSFLRKKLTESGSEVWSFPFVGKNGRTVSVRVCNVVGVASDGRKMWYMSIRRFSDNYHDSLTGGYNHEGFIHSVERLRERNADLRKYAILYIDVKGFKSLNELYGTDGGDNLLIKVYKRFAVSHLEPVISARKGSDHFLLLVRKELVDFDVLMELLDLEWVYGNRRLTIHCTCGIFYIEDGEQEISSMVTAANLAMNSIEDEYATPYAVYEPVMRGRGMSRIEVLSDFENAIANEEFQVYYQPVVDAVTKKTVSAEALVRWVSKERGIVSPGLFIPTLEESGYIVKLDRYVVRKVKRFLTERRDAGLPLVPISVNLSRMDFFVEEEMDALLETLEQNPFLCKYMHFEITESSYRSLKERQLRFMNTMKKLGGEVLLDDFGAGSASLDMIGDYDFNALKIDMHFITRIVSNPKVKMLVEMIIVMAHRLGLRVIAEGVETEEQLVILQYAECDSIQGYLFSKPLSEEDFVKYLGEH